MPTDQRRVMSSATVGSSTVVNLAQAMDWGEYREGHFAVRVEGAGAGENIALRFKHAATNEEDAYVDFEDPVVVALDETGTTWAHVSGFMRWAYWFAEGTFSSDATVTIDSIAKT